MTWDIWAFETGHLMPKNAELEENHLLIHLFIQHTLVGNLWHIRLYVKCIKKDVEDGWYLPLEN